MSLPTRERGLKYSKHPPRRVLFLSLPTRERGLKSEALNSVAIFLLVAPYTGAWIEISRVVGSLTGAVSLPTRERGLK